MTGNDMADAAGGSETYLSVSQAAQALGLTDRGVRRLCVRRRLRCRQVVGNGGTQYRIPLSSLPVEARKRWRDNQAAAAGPESFRPGPSDVEAEALAYSRAADWQRRQADKYMLIINESGGAKGAELRRHIAAWNEAHPDMRTSYPRVLAARRRYAELGVSGLLARYGGNSGATCVPDDDYAYFKSCYLKQGGPSLKSCWTLALGRARTRDRALDAGSFPDASAFLRRLEREMPQDSIYCARHGYALWNRKYGPYIKRDYSGVLPGDCLVSDHAQVDVTVMLPDGKCCYPWVTAWRDYKSGKWVGWLHHVEAPNSDHIFQSFFYALRDHGLPRDVIIDNGKDYRCRDFAGGRRAARVEVNAEATGAMLAQLGITPHFALPYNAQTKPIERDFLRNKAWFSVHMPGYRGGNVTERPEILKSEVKAGRVLSWADYQALMDRYILECSNRMPSSGEVLRGRCADECWEAEHPGPRKVSPGALRLFCMRTSRDCVIGRNGVRDCDLQVSYWAEWMPAQKGEKVYLRRDIKAFNEAWVFRSADHELLGTAVMAQQVAALARSDVHKDRLKNAMAQVRRSRKITMSYIKGLDQPTADDKIMHLAAGVEAVNDSRGWTPGAARAEEKRIALTPMDLALAQEQRMRATGTYDISAMAPPEPPAKPKIYIFESDRDDDRD